MNPKVVLLSLSLCLTACSSTDVDPFMGSFEGNVTFTYTPTGGATSTHVFTRTTVNGRDLTQDTDDTKDVELDVSGDADCHMSGPLDGGVLSFLELHCLVTVDDVRYDLDEGVGTATVSGDTLTFEHTGSYRVTGVSPAIEGTYVYRFVGTLAAGSR